MVVTMSCVTVLLFGTVVYAASYVQGWVGQRTTKAVASTSCNTTSSQALTPRGVTINVYNSTAHTGLAASTASKLQRQGFKVATVDNDPLGKSVLGVGEIRYGPSGLEGANLAALRLPGATMVQDGRMDASVDIVLGKMFKAVKVPPKATKATKATPTPHC
jgi:LytR cell envelope-related transcriptional attenuator